MIEKNQLLEEARRNAALIAAGEYEDPAPVVAEIVDAIISNLDSDIPALQKRGRERIERAIRLDSLYSGTKNSFGIEGAILMRLMALKIIDESYHIIYKK